MNGLSQAAKAAFESGQGKLAPQLIVVIMPAREVALYEEIKRSATKCVKQLHRMNGEKKTSSSPHSV